MSDLVKPLRARLNELEAKALRARDGERTMHVDADDDIAPLLFNDEGEFDLPARVLRDVQAKRQIIDEVMSWRHRVNEEDGWYTCGAATEERDGGECFDERNIGECTCGLEERQRAILAPLAELYAEQYGGQA